MAALEEDKVATSELKNDPVSTDVQPSNDLPHSEPLPDSNGENSESQLNTDISNSETQPSEGLVASETQEEVNAGTLPNSESANHEAPLNNQQSDSEAPLNDQQGESEAPPKNQQDNSDALQNKEQGNSETPLNNQPYSSEAMVDDQLVSSKENLTEQLVDSEAPPSDQLVSSEVTLDEKPAPEAPSNDQLVNSEVLANKDLVNTETQTSNEVVVSETQSGDVLVTSETQPSSEVVTSEAQPSNDVVMSETHPSNDVVMSEALPENELVNSTTHPHNQLSHTETVPDNQFTDHHMLPENQLPNSDTLPDNQMIDTKPIPDNHLAHFETLPNNHLAHSEAPSNNHLANSEALSHDHLANSQMLPQYELVNAETFHDNQLINSQTHYELVNSETLPSYEIVNAETQPNDEDRTPETQPNKRRKKKSIVWEHFTIETVSPGCRRACCKQCKQSFAYSTGSKVAGTSHLKRHIAKGTCPALQRNQDPNQLIPYTPRSRGSGAGTASETPKRRYRSPSTFMMFNQDRCRHEIARMIIMHDYPLHMVEHPGFVAFVQNLQPQFNMVTFNTVQGDCVATYLMEKQNLLRYVEGLAGRVCLTLDMWTSSQSVGYVFITGHFVDSDWKLQKRIFNVIMEPYPDSDSALSHAVAACLSDWSLEGRLFSITTNQALSEVSHENLRPLLSVKNPLILNGQLLVGNCIARTLSSVARDLFASAQDIVKKIRDSVKYVKTSESHEEKFLELKQQLQVPSERTLFIDDQTQWNTTYQMLVAASELKEVFSCLDTSDPDYRGAPSMQDWKLVETLCTYLKPLFDAANILITTTHPPSIAIFHEVWKLQLDLARAVMSEDPFISNLTKIMQEKIDKYWRDCSLVLAIAVVMDPRFKMKLVEFSFPKIYGDDAHVYIKIVDDGIHELFHEYVNLPLPLTPAYAEEGSAGGMKMDESGTLLSDNGLTDFDMYIMETTSQHMKSELDQYLEESLLPRSADFDVLGWWKLNKLKYPTLSKMARDILTIPVSTVPPDSVFDIKSKEMDQYRSSLRPETVEALVCAKDWMQHGAAAAAESSNALAKMEF
ncbi:hypothetical protein L6164_000682 [Bauhinia variegata]|uniref:Uncharacterized protein n=2 Tax=Bauhinia variegata TaxID=167791 RepID=A0ACB9Q768_BAUVA|nr:hypothetical protein L6164_000682 [Bauhinia variegata]